jgi:serine/threonine protein kinase
MTGSRIGHYELEELLGRGGMGEVYRAYDTRRNRRVALKLLVAELAHDQEYQKRFRLESDAAARLNEPHVIPVHDYGEIDGRLFIDMRLVEGPDLGRILAHTGPMDPGRTVDIISQIAGALDAAHAANLIHRDVKPANVLVVANQDRDFAYLVDFGVAYAAESAYRVTTRTGIAIGTLDYMAPERFDGKPTDRRVDVYSLACLLHECLTATRPFTGDSFPALMRAHFHEPPPRPSQLRPELPPALDDVVARGMAKDPGDRYPTAGELAGAARAALAAPPPTVAIPPQTLPGPPQTHLPGPPWQSQQRPPPIPPHIPQPIPPHNPQPTPMPVPPDGHRPFPPGPPFPPPVPYPAPKPAGRTMAMALGAAGLVAVVVLAVVLATRPWGGVGPVASSSSPTSPAPTTQTSTDALSTTQPATPETTPQPATVPTSGYSAAELFTAPENGDCSPVELSDYAITTYDIEALGCRGQDSLYRFFYKYSETDHNGWVAEVQAGRSNYNYTNFTFDRVDLCYDIYTTTYTGADGVLNNSVVYVFRRAPFVAEVGASASDADLPTVAAAMFYWTDTAALC